MNKLLLTAVAAAGMMIAPANAAFLSAEFVFKGDGLNADPLANKDGTCGSPQDFCTADDNLGFDYLVDGLNLNVKGYQGFALGALTVDAGGASIAEVIQDIQPTNSGLGVFSAGEDRNGGDDQVQFKGDANGAESLRFDFSGNPLPVTLSDIEFNSGADRDCSDGGEGGCGFFDLYIDGAIFLSNVAADDIIAGGKANGYVGRVFEFVARTADSGFTIASFKVQEVPIPGALPLLLSGIAGLGFAARRKKTA